MVQKKLLRPTYLGSQVSYKKECIHFVRFPVKNMGNSVIVHDLRKKTSRSIIVLRHKKVAGKTTQLSQFTVCIGRQMNNKLKSVYPAATNSRRPI